MTAETGSTQLSTQRRLDCLTGARFFAAIWVVLLHFASSHVNTQAPAIRDFVGNGQFGVSFFFVLSGFVLAYTYLNEQRRGAFNVRTFMVARLARIYPAYLLSIVISSPFAWILLNKIDRANALIEYIKMWLLQLVMLQAWIPQYFYRAEWNTPSWSLSAEAFFYAVFAVVVINPGFQKQLAKFRSFAIILLLLALSRLAYSHFNPDNLIGRPPNDVQDFFASLLFFNPAIRVLEFLIGLMSYAVFERYLSNHNRINSAQLSWAWLLTLLCSLGLFSIHHSVGVRHLTYPASLVLFAASICLLASIRAGWVHCFFGSRMLLWLGEISYGVYIFQRPIAQYVNTIADRIGAGHVESSLSTFVLFLIVLITFSGLAYRYYELPMRSKIKQLSWAKQSQKNSG